MKTTKLLTVLLALALHAMTPAFADATRSYNRSDTIETSHPNWMRWVPDGKLLSDLSLPGTHDTMSLYGGDLVETQSLPLRSQLDAGIRVLDIRCRHIEDVFAIHHGIVFQNAFFGADVLKVCHDFLQENPTETIIMRLGDAGVPEAEDCTRTYEETFLWYRESTTYGSCLFKTNYTGFNTMPTLGAVRGKVVVIQDFAAEDWHGYLYENDGNLMDMQNEYDLDTIFDRDNKWDIVHDFFRYTDGDVATFTEWNDTVHNRAGRSGRFYMNWTSATSSSGGVYPNAVALYVNPRTLEYLFGRNQARTTGIVWMDFPGAALIGAILSHNFKFVTNNPSTIGDDFDCVFNNISYSATHDGGDQCLDHASQLQSFLGFVLPGELWNLIVSGTQGGENWGYALSPEGFLKQSDWIDGYSHVAVNARSLNCPVTDAQLAAFLTTSRLQSLGGTAVSRAAAAKSLVSGQFPGNRWNVVVKRAPGGFNNWAVSYYASANHSSGWFTDDGEDYHYIVWATSQFNAPPVVHPGGPYVVAEGSPVTFNAVGTTDPDFNLLYFRWDGNDDGVWDTARSTTRTFTWTFPDDRNYRQPRLEVFDGLHTVVVTVPVNVTNVPPRVTVGGAATVVTNTLFTRAGSFSDPGLESRWDLEVDYGDGLGERLFHTNKAFLLSHTYRTTGVFRVLITVDDERNKGTNGFVVTVVNPGPPRLLSLDPPTYDQFEGSSLTVTGRFFYAGWTPGTAVNVNWADGTPVTNVTATVVSDGVNLWRFTATHTYADNPKTNGGDYRVNATIPGTGTLTTPVTVLNYRPTMTGVPTFTLTEGGLLSQLRSFYDPGADTWTIAIDYGDGGSALLTSTNTIYELNHRYLDAGDYEATVTVTDDDGATHSQLVRIIALNAAPNVAVLVTATNRINEGDTVLVSGAFTSTVRDYETFTAMIDWGDGRPRTPAYMVNTLANTKSFTASHRYLDNNSSNTFVITAYISDDDGSTNTRSTTLTVTNTAPVVSAGADVGVPAGTHFTSYGSFTDLGADTHTARVLYGDGTGWQPLPVVNSSFVFDHTFPSNGFYKVTVEITDDDGAVGSDSLWVVTGPPQLSITKLAPTTVRLSWPVHPAPFRLQRRLTLASTNVWQNVGNTISTANGTNSLTLSVPVDQRYWRLVWP